MKTFNENAAQEERNLQVIMKVSSSVEKFKPIQSAPSCAKLADSCDLHYLGKKDY